MFDGIKNLIQTVSGYAATKLLPAALTLFVGLFAAKLILKLLAKALGKTKLDKAAVSLIRSVSRVALYVFLFLAVISKIGIDVSSIVTLASVLTLAISLALQDALTNLIGGFTLLSNKPFALGDYVQIGRQGGSVAQIGLTYTKLLTPDGKTVSIPNSIVDSAEIVNYTTAGTRRVDISIGVSYKSDPEQVLLALLEAAATENVLSTPAPYAAIAGYADGAIRYVLQIFTPAEHYWTVLYAVNRNIYTVFKNRSIQIYDPYLNIHFDEV